MPTRGKELTSTPTPKSTKPYIFAIIVTNTVPKDAITFSSNRSTENTELRISGWKSSVKMGLLAALADQVMVNPMTIPMRMYRYREPVFMGMASNKIMINGTPANTEICAIRIRPFRGFHRAALSPEN